MPPENSQENPRFKKRRRRRKKQVAGKKRDQPTLALLQKKKRFGRYLDVPAWQRLAAPPHGLLRSYWNLMQAVKSYRSSLKWHVLFWCFSAKKKKKEHHFVLRCLKKKTRSVFLQYHVLSDLKGWWCQPKVVFGLSGPEDLWDRVQGGPLPLIHW